MDHLILMVSNWIFICMILCPCFVFAVFDPNCTRTKCECCIDNKCDKGPNYDNECTNGCIDGHRGWRCYLLCNHNCKTCTAGVNVCESCYDAYFLDGNKHCIKCPPNCEECTSSKNCTSCKNGFGNRENSTTCEHCPENCDGACNSKTGVCDSCAKNRYGKFCDMHCLANCKDLPGVRVSRCEQLTGKCHFGCDEGFFGFTCNKSCSNLCIDNVCIQESGKCTKGCEGAHDEPVCFLVSERPNYSSENGNAMITVVLGSILGVAAIAATAVGIAVLVRRRSSRNRQDTSTEVYYQNRLAINEASQDTMPIPETRRDNYEHINNVEGAEHAYQQMSVLDQ